MELITTVLILLFAVVMSSVVAKALPKAIPLPLIQIGVGILIAAVADRGIRLEPEMFFLLFLPPLLFLDAWRIPKDGLFRDIGTILELALGLVLLTVVGVGFLVHWMIPAIPLAVAFALAAILSPTDPVAVTAISARINVPKRLMHILEGEALLNDASGLVCMRFAVLAAMTGVFSLSQATLTFAWLAIGGIAIGTLVTMAITWAKNTFARHYGEDSSTQILISLLIPFAAYLLAEHAEASGILAAVAAGLTMSYAEQSGHALATTRIRRNAVWDTIYAALNGLIFIVLGEQLPSIAASAAEVVQETGHVHPAWLIVYVIVINLSMIGLRLAWAWVSLRFTLYRAAQRGEVMQKPGWRLIAATSIAGVRGTVTLAGILSLPFLLPNGAPFPARDLVIFLAASVIIVSLVLASIFLPALLKDVHIPEESEDKQREDKVRMLAAEAAIEAAQGIGKARPEGDKDADLYVHAIARLTDYYRERIAGYSAKELTDIERYKRSDAIEREVWLAGFRAERQAIYRAASANRISDEVARKLVRQIDLVEEHLDRAES